MRADPGPLVGEKSDRVVRIARGGNHRNFVRQWLGNDPARVRREAARNIGRVVESLPEETTIVTPS